MNPKDSRTGGSFRDPSGFLFTRKGVLFRQVNPIYKEPYDHLISSGLYEELVNQGWLIRHQETNEKPFKGKTYKILRPERVGFISYPYEWCFSQLKDAALLTLEIARRALEKGMVLKDASAYNIQFINGKPILIDTLSFDIYREGSPWEAYRQFCQHFLAPLALASLVDIRLTQLLRVYIDGIPLELASTLLPPKTRFGLSGLALHLHLHSKAQKQFEGQGGALSSGVKLNKRGFFNILNSLKNTVLSLKWKPRGTEWGDYYSATNYSDESLREKGNILGKFIEYANPRNVWDLGANNGLFSREASRRSIETVASDIDPAAVELNYLAIKESGEEHLLPLVIDLTNPSPAMGWAHTERASMLERGPVDMVLALALIHHLCISNNVPLESVAEFLASAGKWAVVEFIPKSDSQVQRLLSSRKDIFDSYHLDGFEGAFGQFFSTVKKEAIPGSERVIYLFRRMDQ